MTSTETLHDICEAVPIPVNTMESECSEPPNLERDSNWAFVVSAIMKAADSRAAEELGERAYRS